MRSGGAMMSLPKEARVKAGYSLVSAAKELKISAGYLSQIEKGQRQISSERAEEIAKLYKSKKEDIFLPTRYSIREVKGVIV